MPQALLSKPIPKYVIYWGEGLSEVLGVVPAVRSTWKWKIKCVLLKCCCALCSVTHSFAASGLSMTGRRQFCVFHCCRNGPWKRTAQIRHQHRSRTTVLLLLLCIWWLSKPPKVSARRGRHTGPAPPPSWTLAIAPPRLPLTSVCNVSTVMYTHTHTHTNIIVQVSKWIIQANCVTVQLCAHERWQARLYATWYWLLLLSNYWKPVWCTVLFW